MIKLQLKRIFKGSTYTIGKLYVNGEYFCDTLEDTDRGLTSEMPISKIKILKYMVRLQSLPEHTR